MFRFEPRELKELLVSALAITFIFSYPQLVTFPLYFLFVGVSFAVHESAHKFMAKSLGAWSEFRMWTEGLAFALLMRIIGGPVFIAPGATYWHKPFATMEDYGKVSAAGPVLNVLMALGFMAAALFVPVMAVGAMINLQLAFFNLIPFPPLDGSKIVRWNPALWGGLVAAAIGLQFFIPGG